MAALPVTDGIERTPVNIKHRVALESASWKLQYTDTFVCDQCGQSGYTYGLTSGNLDFCWDCVRWLMTMRLQKGDDPVVDGINAIQNASKQMGELMNRVRHHYDSKVPVEVTSFEVDRDEGIQPPAFSADVSAQDEEIHEAVILPAFVGHE